MSGWEDMFVSLYKASSSKKVLYPNDVWMTEHFSLSFSDEQIDDELCLKYSLTLNHVTVDECVEEGKMIFQVYSEENNQWDCVLGYYDDYYYCASLGSDYPLGYTVNGEAWLSDDAPKIVSIIVIDDCIYTSEYYLKGDGQ